MKLKSFLLAAVLLSPLAAGAEDWKLPAPQQTGGMPLIEALANRKSTREFAPGKKLTDQQLSNMLWAAWGFNRADRRTVATAMNRQEVSVYLITADGAYLYDAKKNVLELVAKGDFRKDAGRQPFVLDAPYNVALVTDTEKMGEPYYQGVSHGAVSQSIYLWCASEGVPTVVRGSFDRDALAKDLHLKDGLKVMLVQTVGGK